MLLKIGTVYMNMDNVTHITDDTESVDVFFNTSQGQEPNVQDQKYIRFYNDAANALRSYLDSMAVDVLAVYAEKNKPDCATCGDKGHTAVRNGDDDTPCPDCAVKSVMSHANAESLANKAMGMSMKDLPDTFHNTMNAVKNTLGSSGDVIHETLTAWFMAGCIELTYNQVFEMLGSEKDMPN